MSPSESRLFRGIIETQVAALLRLIRAEVTSRGWDLERLPPWLTAATIRAGMTGPTALAMFSASRESADTFVWKGFIHCDVILLLDCPDYHPEGFFLDTFRPRPDNAPFLMCGDRTDKSERSRSAIRLPTARPAFTSCGYKGYHPPIMLSEMIIELMSAPEEFGSLRSGIVPFSIFAHDDDLHSVPALWDRISSPVMRALQQCHDKSLGEEYARVRRRTTSLIAAEGSLHLAKESGVVVLGHDSGHDLDELRRVCDRLCTMGYDARLIREMAEIPAMSNEEKVRLWTLASRFVVMVDHTPSGHILEHELMKEQRTILAVIRRRGLGSSYMIGDVGLVDLNFIRVFEFDHYPEDVLPDAVEWAERIALERQTAYDSYYPWRQAGAALSE
jgi:hypothetical protein